MFGYRVEARLRRDKPAAADSNTTPPFDPEIYKDLLRHTAMTVISVAAVTTALGTTREILVNVTNPANR